MYDIYNMYIKHERKMRNFAKDFLSRRIFTTEKKSQTATVVALSGELGTGKSTFVRAVAHELGMGEHIVSPTFNILKTYKIDCKNRNLNKRTFSNLVHIDAYRLNDSKDSEVLGFDELLSNPKNLIFIEWPENIELALPKTTKYLYFKYVDENTRSIEYHPNQD